MNWYKVFYWMSVADGATTLFGWIGVLTLIATLLSCICLFICSNSAAEEALEGTPDKQTTKYNKEMIWVRAFRRTLTTFGIVSFLSLIMWVAIPTKKQMLGIIAGGAIGNFITRDSSAKAIPSELATYFRTYIKKETEDLDTETKERLGVATPKETLLDKVKDMSKEQLIEYLKKDTTFTK